MPEAIMDRVDEGADNLKLPRTFEEYNEQRKQSFLKVKDYKQAGHHIVGYLCSYAPLEIIDAAGAAAVGLCGTSNETVPIAETVLPANLCPLVKSTYGFALSQKCPFTYFSDLIVGETTCDGKKKMYELLDDLKRTHVLRLPQGQDRPYEREMWYQECKLFKETLEEAFGVTITDDDLRRAAKRQNRVRRAMVSLFELDTLNPPAVSGVEMMSTLLSGTFNFDPEEYAAKIENLVAERKAAWDAGQTTVDPDAKRIIVTGCPTGGVINKVGRTIEEHGAVIVNLDNCMGERTNRMMVDEDADDILRAISDRYLQINCSVMTPNNGRIENLIDMVDKYHADGVVDVVLTACHTFNIEAVRVQNACDEHDVPYMKLVTDYSDGDTGQIETRLEAFIEML